jgi:ubiquinone/menaquinone biosynthesis C-methylase UbiE
MKLNKAERWLVNNPARAFAQRFYEMPLLRRLGGTVEGGRVLEVGCGRGVGLPLILKTFHAAMAVGIDLDPEQIGRARKRTADQYDGRIVLDVGSVTKLPFADASFDAAFDFGILHHVPAWQTGIAEIRRVLRPGGRIFFEEVTQAALDRWIYRRFLEHPRENRFSEAQFLTELQRHGFKSSSPIHRVLFGDIFIGVAKLQGAGLQDQIIGDRELLRRTW